MAALLLLGIGSVAVTGCSTDTVVSSRGDSQECATLKSALSGKGGLTPQLSQRLKNILTSTVKQGLHPESLVFTAIQALMERGDDAERNWAAEFVEKFSTGTLEDSAYRLIDQEIAACDITPAAWAASPAPALSAPDETSLLAEVPSDIGNNGSCQYATVFNPVDPLAPTAVECSFRALPPDAQAQPGSPRLTLAGGDVWYLAYQNYPKASNEFNQLKSKPSRGSTGTQPIVLHGNALRAECSGLLKKNPVGLAWLDRWHNSVGLAVQCSSDAQTLNELTKEFNHNDFGLTFCFKRTNGTWRFCPGTSQLPA